MPVRRPHFERRGQDLFFMISARPFCRLSDHELLVFDEIDGARRVADYGSPDAPAWRGIESLQQRGVVELVQSEPWSSGPHLVVLEPHMDDAILSVGGALAKRAHQQRITVVSSVSRSNFTSYWYTPRCYFDAQRISRLRLEESRLVARMIGANFIGMERDDAPLRSVDADRWSPSTFPGIRGEVDSYIASRPEAIEVERMATRLARLLEQLGPQELWFPIGLSHHIDHRTLRAACFRMLEQYPERFENVEVRAYEERPYSDLNHALHSAAIQAALHRSGIAYSASMEDVTEAFEQKKRLVSVYASQFKIEVMAPRLMSEREDGVAMATELTYRLGKVPSAPHEIDCAMNREQERQLANDALELLRTHRGVRRIAIFVLPSGHVGRWEYVLQTLLRSFPNSAIRVYVDDDTKDLVGMDGQGARVIVHGIESRPLCWLRVLCREMLQVGTLCFLSSWGRSRTDSRAARVAWLFVPFRKRLWVPNLIFLSNALEAAAKHAD